MIDILLRQWLLNPTLNQTHISASGTLKLMTKILYFAWYKEQIGKSEEDLDLPGGLASVSDLLDWLQDLSDGHARALADRSIVRVAVNQEFVQPDDELIDHPAEIAIFPPVTGG